MIDLFSILLDIEITEARAHPKISNSPVQTHEWLPVESSCLRTFLGTPMNSVGGSLSHRSSESDLRMQVQLEIRKCDSVEMRERSLSENPLQENVNTKLQFDSVCDVKLRHSLSLKLRPDDSWIIKNSVINHPNEMPQSVSGEISNGEKLPFSSIDPQSFRYHSLSQPVVLLADT